jgi:hypothetical protein
MLLPIEVKSGVSGKLKSLHILLQEYPHIQKAIVFSGTSFSEIKEQRLSFLPLYYAGRKFF